MTIKMKILLPMIILLLIAMTALLLSNVIQFSGFIDKSLNETLNTAAKVAADEIEIKKKEAENIANSIANDPEIVENMANGNRDALVEISRKLMLGSNMDFTTITDASGIAFARPHAPEKFGDDVTAMPTVSSALKGVPLTAIEPGSTVRMSICCGVPIYDDSKNLLGVVVTGYRLDTDKFVDSIKSIMDCEVSVFLKDERISTTIINENGERAIGMKSSDDVSKKVLEGDTYKGKVNVLGRELLTSYSPIKLPDGNVAGILLVGLYTAETTAKMWSFVMMGIIITVVLVISSVLTVFYISGRIVSPIKVMVAAANELAAGKININVNVETNDEMHDLAEAFNLIIKNNEKQVHVIKEIADGDLTGLISERSDNDIMNHALKTMLELNNDIFSQIVCSANNVSKGSRQISENSQTLAQGSTEQASTVQKLSYSVAEISQKTEINAKMASEAANLAELIKNNAEKGNRQMNDMIGAVKDINLASQNISKVIKVIDDIAFQTNILALNASVEAARAGQYGKGFAVVAEEVRNLAAKSAEAAKNTENLILNSMEKAEHGASIADETAASLTEIITGINESNQLVVKIADSSAEQSSDITEINQSIEQVAQIIQQNSAAAEESASASVDMNDQAILLEKLVSRFKLRA